MRIKVQILDHGPGPEEAIVSILTVRGEEQAVVSTRSISSDDMLEVYGPLATDAGRQLIQLPQETIGGSLRVWVPA